MLLHAAYGSVSEGSKHILGFAPVHLVAVVPKSLKCSGGSNQHLRLFWWQVGALHADPQPYFGPKKI